MTLTHTFRIDYDDATGEVKAVHRCTSDVGGEKVSFAEDVQLPADAAAALKAFVDDNRKAMENVTKLMALRHAAAVSGVPEARVTKLKVGGSLAAVGKTSPKK